MAFHRLGKTLIFIVAIDLLLMTILSVSLKRGGQYFNFAK